MSILLQAADPINPFWDENLLDLIEGIRDAIGDGQIPTIARQIAAILTLIYFSVKSFAMLAGEGNLEVMTLLRPFIFSMVIINFGLLTEIYDLPAASLEGLQKETFVARAKDVEQELMVKDQLMDSVWNKVNSNIEELKALYGGSQKADYNMAEEVLDGFSGGAYDVMVNLDSYVTIYQNLLFTRMTMALTDFTTTITLAGYKGVCYCIFFIQLIILYILKSLGPLAFAFSVTGPFRDSWVQWTSKYIAATFYSAIAFLVLNLCLAVIEYGIGQEINRLMYVVNLPMNEQFMKAIQSYDDYMGYLIIAIITSIAGIISTPTMASWIIQAGSGIGSFASVMAGTAMSGANKAASGAKQGAQAAATGVKKVIKRSPWK